MKRSKTTALLLMSTVPLLLTACSSEPEVQVQEGLYTSVQACSDATGDPSGCREAFASAAAQSGDSAPQYASKEQCAADYEADQCVEQRTSAGTSFIGPMMMGFFMGQLLNGAGRGTAQQAPPPAPAYQDKNKGWAKPAAPSSTGGLNTASRIGAGKAALAPTGLQPNAAPTVSRGGFGTTARRRSDSSSSFGG